MTKAPPIDPCADIRAMIAERKIEDRILYARTYLSDVASGAAPIPVTDRTRLRTLAHALGCQPYYIDKLVKEWREHIGDPLPAPKHKPASKSNALENEAPVRKPDASENRTPKPAPAPPVQQPDHICCDTCHVTRPIAEYHLKTSTSMCRICLAAAKDIRIAARRAERRKAAYEAKQQTKENEPIFGSWCISWD